MVAILVQDFPCLLYTSFLLLVAVEPQGAAAQWLLDVHVQRLFHGLGVAVVALGFKENAHLHAPRCV